MEPSIKKPDLYPVFIAAFVVLLVLSIHGVRWLPFYEYAGLDLENLFLFHTRCPGWPIPYAETGDGCGDPLNRPMVYPPLAYWTMGWVRFFDFNRATNVWGIAIVALTTFGTWIASSFDANRRKWVWAVWFLLLLQMPMVYAVERGNIDALVVPLYMGGVYFLAKRRAFGAGLLFATACWMKVYPVVPSAVVLAALYLNPDHRKSVFWPLFRGFLAGGVVWGLILLPDSYRYVLEVLPRFAAEKGGFGASSHSLYRGWPSLFLKLPLLGLWTYFVSRFLRRDPIFALTAALAISTFFQNLSNDYNLITAYPFLFLLIQRCLRRGIGWLDFAVLVLTFQAFVGDRTLLEAVIPNRGALFVQIIWFVWFPFYALNRIDKGSWPEGNLSLR